MKTIADLRKEFKQQHKIDAQQFTRHANERTYSLDYVHWLEDMVLSQANGNATGERQLTIPDVSQQSELLAFVDYLEVSKWSETVVNQLRIEIDSYLKANCG